MPAIPRPAPGRPAGRRGKIRVAYLSADLRNHAVGHQLPDLFERHDRERFEVIGVSFGPDDKSAIRIRLMSALDRFIDVTSKNDREVAQLLKDNEVDIAVDLMGHTLDGRLGIFAERAAPVQVSYLGYPGTTGADFIDYIIADSIVAPFDQAPFFTEKIVHLPDCYQVNDATRKISERTPARREVGLPDAGFVFCCFNNSYKITAPMFDIWMRLLKAVEGSVLWMSPKNAAAEARLRREAAARGVASERIVFAQYTAQMEDYLARHRLADLFLDSLPYNACTTASDALWAGLPVLACQGPALAGRVAASLLHAIGLPEMVTQDLNEYEGLALKLASQPALLKSIREKLDRNRLSHPAFDTDRFRRGIETAYITMWEIWQRGEAPRSFTVQGELAEGEPGRSI